MKGLLKPLDYQVEALDQVAHNYERGLSRQLIHLFTGGGKTSGIAANVPQWFPDLCEHRAGEGGLLFLAHRREILYQAYQKFKDAYPNRWIGIEMGEYHATGYEDFLFVSVDSLAYLQNERIFKYGNRKFGVIITDEGHHATEDSKWDNILTYFGVGSDPETRFTLRRDREPLSLFLTATPQRHDGRPLAPFLDVVAASYDVMYGIRNGWLTDIRAFHVYNDDVDIRSLDAEEQVDYLIKAWDKYGGDLQTLAFAQNVAQSRLLANTLNEHGICKAAHVDAKTDKEFRDSLLEKFSKEQVKFITNRLVYTEGTDIPNIQCILDNAPTESKPLHIQKLGRGLRPHPGAGVYTLDTAAERREAIRQSPKPALRYIATFDPRIHGMDVVATISGIDLPKEADGLLVMDEVIDVIEEEVDEEAERPIREQIARILGLKVEADEVNVWDHTVENEKLKALTNLRWVVRGRSASLYLPANPMPNAPKREQTPVLWHFKEVDDGWQFYHIVVGGWVPTSKKGFVAPARVQKGQVTGDFCAALKTLDKFLKDANPGIYREVVRANREPATDAQLRYMKNHRIEHGKRISRGTADVLIDDFRIKRKLEDLALK